MHIYYYMLVLIIIVIRKGKLYLVFEFVEKTLLEILESRTNGLDVLSLTQKPLLI